MPDFDLDAEIAKDLEGTKGVDDLDAEIEADLAAETAPVPAAAVVPPPPRAKAKWYESLARGGGQGLSLGFGDELVGGIEDMLRPSKSSDGTPIEYGESNIDRIRTDNKQAQEDNPLNYGVGQGLGGIAPGAALALSGAGVGGAVGGAIGNAIGGAAPVAGGILGSMLGGAAGGAAAMGTQEAGTREGTLADRASEVNKLAHDNPAATAALVAAPVAGELLPGIGGAVVKYGRGIQDKAVKGADEVLTHVYLSPAQRAALVRSGKNLSDVGKGVREAGLTKARTWMDRFRPTSASRIADNAKGVIDSAGSDIQSLEDQLLSAQSKTNSLPLRDATVDTNPIADRLEAAARGIGDVQDPTAARDAGRLQRHADMFRHAPESAPAPEPIMSVPEPVPAPPPVQESLPLDAPGGMSQDPQLSLLGQEKILPPVEGAPAPQLPVPGPVNPQQMSLPIGREPIQRPLPLDMQGQQSLDLPATQLATPQAPVPVQPELPIPQGPAVQAPFGRVAVNPAGRGVQMQSQVGAKPMPELPAPPQQLPLPEYQQSLPGVPQGARPPVRPDIALPAQGPALPSEMASFAPEPVQQSLPYTANPAAEQLELPGVNAATGPRLPPVNPEAGLPPANLPLEPKASPNNLGRLIRSARHMGNKIDWTKKQIGGGSPYGEDMGRKMAWKDAKDIIQRSLEDAGKRGDVDPSVVGAYGTAKKNFSAAAGAINPALGAAERGKSDIGLTDLAAAAVGGPAAAVTTVLGKGGLGPGLRQASLRKYGNAAAALGRGVEKSAIGGRNMSKVYHQPTPIERARQENPGASNAQVEGAANEELKSNLLKRLLPEK